MSRWARKKLLTARVWWHTRVGRSLGFKIPGGNVCQDYPYAVLCPVENLQQQLRTDHDLETVVRTDGSGRTLYLVLTKRTFTSRPEAQTWRNSLVAGGMTEMPLVVR